MDKCLNISTCNCCRDSQIATIQQNIILKQLKGYTKTSGNSAATTFALVLLSYLCLVTVNVLWLFFTVFIVLQMSSYCICSVTLLHGAVGWSALFDEGISWSYSLTFWCILDLFYSVGVSQWMKSLLAPNGRIHGTCMLIQYRAHWYPTNLWCRSWMPAWMTANRMWFISGGVYKMQIEYREPW